MLGSNFANSIRSRPSQRRAHRLDARHGGKTMRTVNRVLLPHEVYEGRGKTLEAAIEDAHKKIPRPRQGASLQKDAQGKPVQPFTVVPASSAPADVIIRSKVVDFGLEAGGIAGVREFYARVIAG